MIVKLKANQKVFFQKTIFNINILKKFKLHRQILIYFKNFVLKADNTNNIPAPCWNLFGQVLWIPIIGIIPKIKWIWGFTAFIFCTKVSCCQLSSLFVMLCIYTELHKCMEYTSSTSLNMFDLALLVERHPRCIYMLKYL